MSSKVQDWQKIVSESHMLKELAINGHWTNFLSLSDTRLKHMREFFSDFNQEVDHEYISTISQDIQKIREDDKTIHELLASKQETLANDLLPLQTGMRLIEQYRQNI